MPWPVASRESGNVEVRNKLADIREVGNALLEHHVFSKGTHRDRNFVDAFLAFGGRHHNFFQQAGILPCI